MPPPAGEPVEPPADSPPAAATSERFDRIRLKLLSLGDQQRPIEPDSIHRPGETPHANDNADPMDDEGRELIADLIALGVVTGHVKLVAKKLKARKPPQRPGEPNERMMEWYRAGVAYNVGKLIGRSAAMGPTMKMFAGAILMTVGMVMDAETIPGDVASPPAGAAAAAAPTPAAAPAPETAPPAPPSTGGRVLELAPSLGRFR